jgi:hypothetical protein
MRFLMGTAVMALVGLSSPAALADDYGEKICRQYGAKIPMDCACAGAPLADEYDEEELTIVIQFLNNAADPNAKFEELFELEKKFGKERLKELGERFDKLAAGDLKACIKG